LGIGNPQTLPKWEFSFGLRKKKQQGLSGKNEELFQFKVYFQTIRLTLDFLAIHHSMEVLVFRFDRI